MAPAPAAFYWMAEIAAQLARLQAVQLSGIPEMDLRMLMGAGWPMHLGGIFRHLDRG